MCENVFSHFQIKKESRTSAVAADDGDGLPEQKELRQEKPSIIDSLTGDNERATLLGKIPAYSINILASFSQSQREQ